MNALEQTDETQKQIEMSNSICLIFFMTLYDLENFVGMLDSPLSHSVFAFCSGKNYSEANQIYSRKLKMFW